MRKGGEKLCWLGNLSPRPVKPDGIWWKTAEALFQALRYPIGAVNEKGENIREIIRAQKSPMAAKMKAKSRKSQMIIEPMGVEDLKNMKMVLRLKFKWNCNPLERDLLATGDRVIVEDCSKRPRGSGLFWGAKRLADGTWDGTNMLGQLLMELRTEIRNRPAVQK